MALIVGIRVLCPLLSAIKRLRESDRIIHDDLDFEWNRPEGFAYGDLEPHTAILSTAFVHEGVAHD